MMNKLQLNSSRLLLLRSLSIKGLTFIVLTMCISACSYMPSKQEATRSDKFYHYSIWYAFVNRVFDGLLTTKELKQQGDIGLGSYTQLDGELIMLDGVPYQAKEDGSVNIAPDKQKIVYANATFFDSDFSFSVSDDLNYPKLREHINAKMPSKNMFYAFKIKGTFNYMKLGGLHKQEPPYTDGLDVLIPKRPIFEKNNVTGTMVGFFCPEFIGNINVAAYHLHFISDDRRFGGHVLSFNTKQLNVEMDEITEYHFVLPNTAEYRRVGFDKEFQYKKK